MWYQKSHYRNRHGFNLLPLIVLGLFFLMGGWRLFFLLPLFLVPLALFWFFSPMARRWQQEHRRGDWGNWGDWSSGFNGEKRKNAWQADDDAETEGRTFDAKRKNDDDVYYV
jgi:hypothetical protein